MAGVPERVVCIVDLGLRLTAPVVELVLPPRLQLSVKVFGVYLKPLIAAQITQHRLGQAQDVINLSYKRWLPAVSRRQTTCCDDSSSS